MRSGTHVGGDNGGEFDALRKALSVTPSSEFVARVRERLRKEPLRTPPARWWRLTLVGAAAATIIVVAVVSNGRIVSRRDDAPGGAVPSGRAAEPHPGAVVQTVPVPERAIPPIGAEGSRVAPTSRAVGTRTRPGTEGRAASDVHDMAVLVPATERLAIDKLLVAMRAGRTAVPALGRVVEDENGLLPDPKPIEIPLLKPIEPLPGMVVDRSGSKDK